MSFWTRINEIHMEKKMSLRILATVEIILLLLGILGLFGKDNVYKYDIEDAVVDYSVTAGENAVEFQNIVLPAGTYQVKLQYETDTDSQNFCGVSDKNLLPQNLRTNGVLLYSGRQGTDYELWLMQSTSTMTVYVQYSGNGSLDVFGLEIYQTNAWNRIFLFLLVVLLIIVNICVIYVQYDRYYIVSVKQKNVMFLLGIIILFASMPLFVHGIISAGDVGYHLMRVEGIRDGILSGQFPIRISPKWQQGYGYASPVFYGETLLYPAGLFRLIGFSMVTSYRLYMALLTVATVWIAYFCFKKIFCNEYIGVFCSALYTLSVYRFYKTYICGSWGETLGVLLLPFLVYGFYRVFSEDTHKKDYKKSWIPLTIGFTLLVQSHLLTGEMAGVFTILLCIILIKKVFCKERFMVLAKTVIYSILLGAWFLIPFADYMLTGDFVIHNVSARTIQDRGLYPAHLLFTFFREGGNVFFTDNGMAETQAMGIGLSLLAALLIWCFMRFDGKTKGLLDKEIALGRITAWFAFASMTMSLSLFPWDRIHSLGGIMETLVSSIQFPNRFLTIANVCLVTVAGVIAKYILVNGKKLCQTVYFVSMIFMVSVSSIFMVNSVLQGTETFKPYNSESIGTGYISGAEYLPYGADASKYMWHNPKASDGIIVEDYVREELGGEVEITNTSSNIGNVTFSLLYYKGYHAYDMNTGTELNCYAGDNFEVTVEIPEDFEGRIRVAFESPWYWRVGEAITLVTMIMLLATSFYENKRNRKVVEK